MKTSRNYRERSGQNAGASRSNEEDSERYLNDAYRRNRGDNYRGYPEDRNYDRDNRVSFDNAYNNYDRMHSSNNRRYNDDSRRNEDAYNRSGRSQWDDRSSYSNNPPYIDRSHPHNERWPVDQDRRTWRWSPEQKSFRTVDNDDYDSERGYDEHEDYTNYGYRGSNARDFNTDGNHGTRYNPSETYGRNDRYGYTYRQDPDYEREQRRNSPEGIYSWGREDKDESKGDYGYYESYPSYGQSEAYGDHERYSGKTGRHRSYTDQYGETDYDDNRRPNIRDRNSW